MEQTNLAETSDFTAIQKELKTTHKSYFLKIGGLIVLNTFMFATFIQGRSFIDNLLTSLNANLIGFNIVGLILGTIVAILLSYKRKYLRASLLSILVIQSIMTIGLVLIVIMTIVGWYPN